MARVNGVSIERGKVPQACMLLKAAGIKRLAGPEKGGHSHFEIGRVDFVEVKHGTRADKFLRLLGKAGICLGHVVVLRANRLTAKRFAHEIVHVRQWETWGPLFFLLYPVLFWHFEAKAEKAERRADDYDLPVA